MTTELNIIDFLPTYFLIATVLVAAVTDVFTHRIPNNLLAPALVLALLTGIATGGVMGLMSSLAGLVVGFAMLLPIYSMGAMAAGDVKLLAVAGAFLGPEGALVAGQTVLGGVACKPRSVELACALGGAKPDIPFLIFTNG